MMSNAVSSVRMDEVGKEARNASPLVWHGMFLFVLGLLTGFVELAFANERMGLAAHLEGVMNGTFLVALGGVWPRGGLSSRPTTLAYWGVLYGTYANWALTTLAAVFGTGAMSPILAAGRRAHAWQENLVTVGFITVGLAMVASSVMILSGLRRTTA